MTGEMHEVSRAIGGLEEAVEGLRAAQSRANELFDGHCHDDADRHTENIATMRAIRDEVAGVRTALQSQGGVLALSRGKLAALAVVGLLALTVVGWLLQAGLSWIVQTLLKSKFGG